MTEEPRSTPSPVAPSPLATASGARPYPSWMLFGLGALCCALWLAAVLLDPWMMEAARMPAWLDSALHVLLVLAVPTLILGVLRSPRLPARRHARAFYSAEALVMALVAIPALLPYLTPTDLLGLPLRLPTLSLGVALAAVDPLVSEPWRARHQDYSYEQWWLRQNSDASTAVVAGVGFSAVILAAAFVVIGLISHTPQQCTGNQIACGAILNTAYVVICVSAFACVLAGLFGVWLGYVLGAWIARSDRLR